jgi:hypothetical protein
MNTDMDTDKDKDIDLNMDIINYAEMPDLPISRCNTRTSKFKSMLENICRLLDYLQYFKEVKQRFMQIKR